MTIENTIRTALETTNLSEAARSVIETLLADCRIDEETTARDLLDVLEDGAALAELGLEDQEAVEDAYGFLEAL